MKKSLCIIILILLACDTKQTKSFPRQFIKPHFKQLKSREIEFRLYKINSFEGFFYTEDFSSKGFYKINDSLDFVAKISSKGKGPNEYMRASGWRVFKEGIYIADNTT